MGERKEFLQSEEWLRLQEATGKEIIPFSEGNFVANGIVHTLPIVGQYLYVPRGPIVDNFQFSIFNFQTALEQLIQKAKEKSCRWIRIEPETEEVLGAIKKSTPYKIVKAPRDMQPREILVMDITASEEELLAQMKGKTRYNIRLAEKRGVKVFETREEKYIQAFLDLITATSGRKGITSHPREYYQNFFQVLPESICQLFVAEFEGGIIAANIVIMYEGMATYLHGGTSDVSRDVMAPYLLQWAQIKAAKRLGYHTYDFGGVRTDSSAHSWKGITKFKQGFAPNALPKQYPGAYDIVLDKPKYVFYRILQRLRSHINL